MPPFCDRYELFVFDLDGTLADTRGDIRKSLNHALAALGEAPLDLETVTRFVGNGARTLLERALGPGAGPDRVERALRVFLAQYFDNCTRETRRYNGVFEALEGLSSRPLAVLTNKPDAPTRKILEALGIADRFQQILGGDSAPRKKPDPAGLLHIARSLGLAIERTLLVGDSGIDIATSQAAGAGSALVTYGYQSEEGLARGPGHVLASLLDLLGPIY